MVWWKHFLMLVATKNLEVRHSILDELTIFNHITLLSVIPFSIANDLASVEFWEVVILKADAEGNGLKFWLLDWIGGFVVIKPQRWLVPERWPLKYIVPH